MEDFSLVARVMFDICPGFFRKFSNKATNNVSSCEFII